jgi:hypothetical protein
VEAPPYQYSRRLSAPSKSGGSSPGKFAASSMMHHTMRGGDTLAGIPIIAVSYSDLCGRSIIPGEGSRLSNEEKIAPKLLLIIANGHQKGFF